MMTNQQMLKYGKGGILMGFGVSLLYYTLFLGAPIFIVGVLFILSTNLPVWKKLLWVLVPAILWFPSVYFLMVAAYELNK